MFDADWYNSGDIVPDQVTPASDATPLLSIVSGNVGVSPEYARGDHQHPLQVSTVLPAKDTAVGEEGCSKKDTGTGTGGTSNVYSSATHQHPLNIDPTIANVPLVNATAAANGTSDYYCRNDHVHPQQLTYDGNVTATKFIKTGGLATEILCANGDTTAIVDIDSNAVQKTGKPLQIVQGYLRYGGKPPQYDDEESESSDDEDYQTRGKIYSQYVNKTQTETITGRKTFKNNQLEIQLTVTNYVLNAGSSDSFASVKCGAIQINPTVNNYNEGIRISRSTISEYSGIYLGCDPNSTTGTTSDQWSIVNTHAGELRIGVGDQLNQSNKALIISADGQTLTFNGRTL
ncbi:MAG: hypothetical protein EZS28_040651 [Streblomastix strix]|uniref:Uncharacterized protein n=1 Tax=Streblomastix strix TaxID=222440 RepID=A0A5J4U1E0_9EUKA|nr:MAG: hypothetical protein EZS28_040651 [Streblomastix strix]